MFRINFLDNIFGEDEKEETDEDDISENTESLNKDIGSEIENRMDEIQKEIDDISAQSETFESEMNRFEDRISSIEENVSDISDRTDSMMKMYDDFAAGVNPLAKTTDEKEINSVAEENSDDPSNNSEDKKETKYESQTEGYASDNKKTSGETVQDELQVVDGCYPVHNVNEYQPILDVLVALGDKQKIKSVINRLVDDRFITNILGYEIEEKLHKRKEYIMRSSEKDDVSIAEINDLDMYRFYEKLILVIAENASEK